nr:alpha/beta hydrolase [uncultured Flavobacterium sp.]
MHIEENYILIQNSSLYYKKISPENATNTLVLLHDSLGCTVLWRDWLDLLAQELNVTVVSYDRRGYGKSDNYTIPRPINYLEQEAEILDELIQKLELQNVHLFGFSDGASIATIYAGMFPNKIHSLTIEGVHVLIEEATLEGVRQAKKTLETTQIAKVLEKYHGDKVMDLYLAWTETWLAEEHQTWNIEHFISKIIVPTLVIQGEFDEFGSAAQMDAFDVVKRVEKYWVKDAAHTAHKEKKEEVFKKITSFIKQHLV